MSLRPARDTTPARIGAPIIEPCPSVQRATLGAVDPDGVLIRCGMTKGHSGDHEFRITWSGPGIDLLRSTRRTDRPRAWDSWRGSTGTTIQ